MQAQHEKTTGVVLYGFALSALGAGGAAQIVGVLALRFMTDNLAISAAVAGSLFALIQVWDAFINPLVGYYSDRTRSRWGRRLPYVMGGSIILPLAVVALFAPPVLPSTTLMVGFLALVLMLHGVGYSLVAVPMYSMGVEVTDDYHERSRIMTYRSNGGYLSGMLGSTLPPWLLVVWGSSRTGHGYMGLTVGLIILVLCVGATFMLRGVRATQPAHGRSATSLWGQARLAWDNKPFRILVLTHVIFMAGVATAISSNAYFSRYVLHRTDAWLGLFYIFLTSGNVVATPMWMRLSKRFDKKPTYLAALLVYGLCVGSWIFSGPTEPYAILIGRVLITGVAMSGVGLLAFSMLSDAIRYDYIVTGHRREGAFSGFVSLIDKLSYAIGLAIMGFLLAKMGYTSSSHGAGAVQSHNATFAVVISFAIIPAVTAFLAILTMSLYKLKEGDLVERATEPSDAEIAADLVA